MTAMADSSFSDTAVTLDLFAEARKPVGIKKMRALRHALMKAIDKGDAAACAELFEQGVTPHFITNRMTPLRTAIWKGNNAIVEMVLRARANPDTQADSKLTPIHFAICVKNLGAIELLLASGADVRKPTLDGASTLEIAIQAECLPALRLMLDAGLHPLTPDAKGVTPMDKPMTDDVRHFLRAWLVNEAAHAALSTDSISAPTPKPSQKTSSRTAP